MRRSNLWWLVAGGAALLACSPATTPAPVMDVAPLCSAAPGACNDGEPCTRDACVANVGCSHILDYAGAGCTRPAPANDVTILGCALSASGAADESFHPDEAVMLSLTLDAAADHPEYPIEVLLFPVAATPGGEAHGAYLGLQFFSVVRAGVAAYRAEVRIPRGIAPGRYALRVHAYPDGPFTGADGSAPIYTVAEEARLPRLDLLGFSPDQQVLLVDAGDAVDPAAPTGQVPDPFAGGVRVVSRDADAGAVTLTAVLDWAEGAVTGLPLLLWEAGTGRWVPSLSLRGLSRDAPMAFHVDAALASADAAAVRALLTEGTPAAAAIRLRIGADGAFVEAPCAGAGATLTACRHELVVPATLFLPAPPPAAAGLAAAATTNTAPLTYARTFSRSAGDWWANGGISFFTQTQLSTAGYTWSLDAGLPAAILGNPFYFARVRASTSGPVSGNASSWRRIDMIGLTLVDTSTSGATVSLGEVFPTLVKEIAFETWIFSPIPMKLSMGPRGSFGVPARIQGTSALATANAASLGVSVTPTLTVGGFAAAEAGLLGFAAGVELSIDLLKATLTASSGGNLAVFTEASSGNRVIRGSLSERMSHATSFVSGRLSVYATWWSVEWCDGGWWPPHPPYPCGGSHERSDEVLTGWAGFGLSGEILNWSTPAYDLVLSTCTPSYDCTGKCGTISNGCGRFATCGGCTPPETCGGGGVRSVCGCRPRTYCNGSCGLVADGCGGQLDCGNPCQGPNTCGGGGWPNVCGCRPQPCAGRCGVVPNGCGGQMNCGGCPVPQTCGGGGVVNVCGCTPTASCTGKCGLLPDGCGNQLDCGGCTSPQTCGGAFVANVCGQPSDVCGNGVLDGWEPCDGAVFLDWISCESETLRSGTLACTRDCQLDRSGCTGPRIPCSTGDDCMGYCGEGTCACEGAPNPGFCSMTCATTDECPAGYTCVPGGFCQFI